MNAEAATEQKTHIESCIRKDKDGSLARYCIDLERAEVDAAMVAEVLVQYLFLARIVRTSLGKVQAIGVRRFGKQLFDKTCKDAYEQLGKNPEIVKALNMIPWAEPHQPISK
jgi:hypothetical protein